MTENAAKQAALHAELKRTSAGLPPPATVGEAELRLPGREKPVKLNVLRGTAGADAIDVSSLYKRSTCSLTIRAFRARLRARAP